MFFTMYIALHPGYAQMTDIYIDIFIRSSDLLNENCLMFSTFTFVKILMYFESHAIARDPGKEWKQV